MPRDLPIIVKIDEPYSGIRYVGRADGALSIQQGDAAAIVVPISTGGDRTSHAAVPNAKIAASFGSAYTTAELGQGYLRKAVDAVQARLDQITQARSAALLDASVQATTSKAMADGLIRYAVFAKKLPPRDVGSALDQKLNVAAIDGVAYLLGEGK